jgi:hypothetical protein
MLLDGGEVGVAGLDTKLGSVGESMASGGVTRQSVSFLGEMAFGEGVAEGLWLLLGDADSKRIPKLGLFIEIGWGITFASEGAYSDAADRASTS